MFTSLKASYQRFNMGDFSSKLGFLASLERPVWQHWVYLPLPDELTPVSPTLLLFVACLVSLGVEISDLCSRSSKRGTNNSVDRSTVVQTSQEDWGPNDFSAAEWKVVVAHTGCGRESEMEWEICGLGDGLHLSLALQPSEWESQARIPGQVFSRNLQTETESGEKSALKASVSNMNDVT